MPFAELKTGALSLRPYSDINNNHITGQKLARFPSLLLLFLLLLLLNNKDININKTILIRLYTLCEFLRCLLCNYGTKTLRKITAD
jgi:hypothetical protein